MKLHSLYRTELLQEIFFSFFGTNAQIVFLLNVISENEEVSCMFTSTRLKNKQTKKPSAASSLINKQAEASFCCQTPV